jgi:hypothetical protein
MAKEKSIVEEAIIQMKNLEEAVAENAKGILASTMKEEIKELVKESLTEQEDEIEMEPEMDIDSDEMETDDEMDSDEMETDDEMDSDEMNSDEMDMDGEEEDMEEPIDLTDKSDEEVLRVFQLMGPDDNIIVTKDDAGNINLKDDENEYMIVGESDEEFYEEYEEEYSETYESVDDIVDTLFSGSDDEDEYKPSDLDDLETRLRDKFGDKYDKGEVFMDYPEDEDEESYEEESEGEEIMYEIEMSEDDDVVPMSEEDEVMYEIEMSEEEGEEEYEEYNESLEESKKSFKAKGKGMGKPKFSYDKNPNQGQGFKVVKKSANKTMGTGNAKKVNVYKDKETLDGEFKIKPKGAKKTETKEAARTYGNGSKSGRGLRKGITPNRNLTFEGVDSSELQILREKNEEYRKALNVFRNKLNEVAVFNSNLAYATRLFTEHSTSKQEKIKILKRFDSVETIKESKNLYKVIKDELSQVQSQPMNESFERKIESTPATGSAVNLIESKTYENPQFLRMKDLMAKLK